MSYIEILLTTFLTVISGTLVFILGQIVMKISIGPFERLLDTISKIEDSLIFYANVYCNPGLNPDACKEASKTLRSLSTQLISRANSVTGYSVFEKLNLLPKKKNLA